MIRVTEQHVRIIEVELNEVIQDPGTRVFDQPLHKGQVVHVKLIGLGNVLNEPHYAIVWDFEDAAGHLVIIPLTSQKRPNDKNNIGIIEGITDRLPAVASVVKIEQVTTVSRKAIHILKKDSTDSPPDRIPVSLSPTQLLQVEDFFRTRYLKELNLMDVLVKKINNFVPLSIDRTHLSDLFRPVQYVIIGTDLYFRCSNYSCMVPIPLADVGYMKLRDRNSLVYNLCSLPQQLILLLN